jgi:alkaline phosphatase D
MKPIEAPAPAALPLDRRSLLKSGMLGGGLLGAGLLAAPLHAQMGRGFTHGIASGEPAADRVLLWTRYAAAAPATLRYEVADSLDFAHPVSGGEAAAGPETDWCAKAWATGLAPGRWYYYRFVAPDGTMSDVGRTRTLPEGPTDRFRMAVFSCANIGFGWFNAYGHAAEADAFDLAVHLGDYYYEYKLGEYPDARELVPGRAPQPANEIVSLADYRQRHAEYRSDRDLQRLTQLYPMVLMWDDHETANDSWEGGAENHQPATEGPWNLRKAAAMRAYHEWLPVSDEPWKRYDIGDLATMFRLETRLTARAKQFDLGDVLAKTNPDQFDAALKTFENGAWQDPSRELMGAAQQQWLAQGMADSVRSGRKWQVLAQQIVMGSLALPPHLLDRLPAGVPGFVKVRLQQAAAAAAVGLPFNMDAWDGYPAARRRLLDAARAADANLVVLSGDSHNAWACELGGAGVEFAGTSITSPGAETYLPWIKAPDLARALVAANADLAWCETARRGYMAIELTPARVTGEWRFLDTITARSTALAATNRLSAAYGARKFSA